MTFTSILGYLISFVLGIVGGLFLERIRKRQSRHEAIREITSHSVSLAKEISEKLHGFDQANANTQYSQLGTYFFFSKSITDPVTRHNFNESLGRVILLDQKCYDSWQNTRKAIDHAESWHTELCKDVSLSVGEINNPGSLVTYRGLLDEARVALLESLKKTERFAARDTKKKIKNFLEEK